MVSKKLFGLFVLLVFALGFVVAATFAHFVTMKAPRTIDEDISIRLNISINNSDLLGTTQNITEIYIILPENFTYTSGTIGIDPEGTDVVRTYLLTSNATFLNITNATAGVIGNASTGYFRFNVTALTPGSYNITIVTSNSTKIRNTTYLEINVSDLTAPYSISFIGITPANNASLSYNSSFINVSASDNANVSNVRFYLYYNATNATAAAVTTNSLLRNNTNFTNYVSYLNYSNLLDGYYSVNITVNDTSTNQNSTTRRFTVDKTYPAIVINDSDSPVNYANQTFNSVYVTVNLTETNFGNITFSLYNTSGIYNTTVYNATVTKNINWTSVPDGNYTYQVNISDTASNINATTTQAVNIDKTAPAITFSCDSSTLLAGELMTCTCSATDVMQTTVTPSFTTHPVTAEAGSYSTICTAADVFANSATSTISYIVSSTRSGGGSSGSTKTPVTNITGQNTSATNTQTGTSGSTGETSPETGTGDQAAGTGSASDNVKQGLTVSSWIWIIVVIVIIVAIVIILLIKGKKKPSTYLKVKSR